MQVLNVFNITETNFPEADVHVSTLDAFFGALVDAAPHLNLSVVTGEIGDSWIYGAPLSCVTGDKDMQKYMKESRRSVDKFSDNNVCACHWHSDSVILAQVCSTT